VADKRISFPSLEVIKQRLEGCLPRMLQKMLEEFTDGS
jgi:hypothetical protein